MDNAVKISTSLPFKFPQRTGRFSHKCNNKEINSFTYKLQNTVLRPKQFLKNGLNCKNKKFNFLYLPNQNKDKKSVAENIP